MHKIHKKSYKKNETDEWLKIYSENDLIQRRRFQMPEKLHYLGIRQKHKDLDVMDMCCGHGEALDALYHLGFRKLTGVDLNITNILKKDKRFKIIQCDVTRTRVPSASKDWITCIHSLHHLGSPEKVEAFLFEVLRILRPNGKLSIIDFPNSIQIQLAFWFFRKPQFHFTNYQKTFGRIIREEWCFLEHFLRQWRQTDKLLFHNKKFDIKVKRRTLFYYYLTLQKK